MVLPTGSVPSVVAVPEANAGVDVARADPGDEHQVVGGAESLHLLSSAGGMSQKRSHWMQRACTYHCIPWRGHHACVPPPPAAL